MWRPHQCKLNYLSSYQIQFSTLTEPSNTSDDGNSKVLGLKGKHQFDLTWWLNMHKYLLSAIEKCCFFWVAPVLVDNINCMKFQSSPVDKTFTAYQGNRVKKQNEYNTRFLLSFRFWTCKKLQISASFRPALQDSKSVHSLYSCPAKSLCSVTMSQQSDVGCCYLFYKCAMKTLQEGTILHGLCS